MADDKLLDIMRSRGINPDGATTVTERTQRNLEALSVFNSDANGSFFQQQVLKRFNNLRRWLIRKKHDEQDKQKMQGQVELLLDDWAFHHGGPPKTPSEQANCIEDVHERMRQIGNGVVSRKQAREERAMDGPLGEFADLNDTFTDLPSDGNFADALVKHDPSLKQYRKGMV